VRRTAITMMEMMMRTMISMMTMTVHVVETKIEIPMLMRTADKTRRRIKGCSKIRTKGIEARK
jgi:hypothetical protein